MELETAPSHSQRSKPFAQRVLEHDAGQGPRDLDTTAAELVHVGEHQAGEVEPRMAPDTTDNRARMSRLAASFHFLTGKPGVDPWDPDRLDAWAVSQGITPAEGDCVSFVLHVWNPSAPWQIGPFDAMAALARWDARHRAAFVAWASAPWWP